MWFRITTKPRDQRGGSPPRGGAGRWQSWPCSGCSPVCFRGFEHESHGGLSEFEPAPSPPRPPPPCRGSDQGRWKAAVACSLQVKDTSASLHAGSPRSHGTGQKIKFLYVERYNENVDRMSQNNTIIVNCWLSAVAFQRVTILSWCDSTLPSCAAALV